MLQSVGSHTASTFGARIYLGSREGYAGREISERELIDAIGLFQHKDTQNACVVRLTRITFLWDKYVEPGWEIGLMNYPKGRYTSEMLWSFADELAQHLLLTFKQNRISVERYEDQNWTIMYEHPNAEQVCPTPAREAASKR